MSLKTTGYVISYNLYQRPKVGNIVSAYSIIYLSLRLIGLKSKDNEYFHQFNWQSSYYDSAFLKVGGL